MTKDESRETVYPPEYAHIENKVRVAQERARQLEEQIKNVPANSKPALVLKPSGFRQRPYFNREEKIASLENEIVELKNTTFNQIEKELREADPELARLVMDTVREDLFPSEAKQMSVQEKNEFRSQPKDVEQAQDLMNSYFSSNQKRDVKDIQENRKEAPKKEAVCMSLRFSQGLNYNRASDKIDKSPDSTSKDIDLDTLFPSGPAISEKSSKELSDIENFSTMNVSDSEIKEPEKSSKPDNLFGSLSARYSQTLGYTKAIEKPKFPSDKLRDKEIDKSPDKD